MDFFKKFVPAEPKRTALTIIAKGNKVSGDMTITGKLHVDGLVEGSISSIENVSIGRTGHVNGCIKAKNITVNGLLEGEVYCDHLHIIAGGRVVASVVSLEMTTDTNSQFIGERREGSESICKKIPHEQQKIAELELDIIDNLPSKVTLDSPEKSAAVVIPPQKKVDVDKQVKEVSDQTPKKQKLDNPIDGLDVLSDMEGLAYLDELDVDNESKLTNTVSEQVSKVNDAQSLTEDMLSLSAKKPAQMKSKLVEPEKKQPIKSESIVKKANVAADTKVLERRTGPVNKETTVNAQVKTNLTKKNLLRAQKELQAAQASNDQAESENSKIVNQKTTKVELKF